MTLLELWVCALLISVGGYGRTDITPTVDSGRGALVSTPDCVYLDNQVSGAELIPAYDQIRTGLPAVGCRVVNFSSLICLIYIPLISADQIYLVSNGDRLRGITVSTGWTCKRSPGAGGRTVFVTGIEDVDLRAVNGR